ncbi:hypothetical protein [Flavobacterium degerlachei]|jgi:hypothetical protein|uniref:hypothetical protein n=1 Tax=Flavobacterium degerlachei TaxID=229203 RepID=UPI000B878C1B|nr:hypothetical protein [Flavobacterium degerlachei]
MKKKQLIISLSLAVTVLFTILSQSFHTYEHFVKQFSQTECHHKYNGNGPEITHQHHKFDDCKVCHFTFGSYISPVEFAYKLNSNFKTFTYFHETADAIIVFSGSLYSHRGPPVNNLG